MTPKTSTDRQPDRRQNTSRKSRAPITSLHSAVSDSLSVWIDQYLDMAVSGVRSAAVAQKVSDNDSDKHGSFDDNARQVRWHVVSGKYTIREDSASMAPTQQP